MKNYTLCDHTQCPLIETCARYLPELDKTLVVHFATMPYNPEKGKCGWYEPYDPDDVQEIADILKL